MIELRKAFDTAYNVFLACAVIGVALKAIQHPHLSLMLGLGCWGVAGLLGLCTKRDIDAALAEPAATEPVELPR